MLTLRTESDTVAYGSALAAELRAGSSVALVGDLGAGKTHLAKGIVAGMGGSAEVTSPTFNLVHEYRDGRMPVFHFDFYRLESAAELLGVGWDDYLDEQGVVVVEWADKFPELLPADAIWLHLGASPAGRVLRRGISAPSQRGELP